MINFLKYRYLYFIISFSLIVVSIYALIINGLNFSIDFTGGSLIELSIQSDQSITTDQIQSTLTNKFTLSSVQSSGPNQFILRTQALTQAQNQELQSQLTDLGEVTESRFESIGPTLGKELIQKTIIGLTLAIVFILLYLRFRFKDKKFGICAVIAMLHDSLIMVGSFAFIGFWLQIPIDALFVTAVLTILSFSVHDTIVVYDRIREIQRLNPDLTFYQQVNKAITETLTRSLNNSLTIIFMLLSLFLLGGDTTKHFVLALLIGTIAGTYSSTFTAAPLLVLFTKKPKV